MNKSYRGRNKSTIESPRRGDDAVHSRQFGFPRECEPADPLRYEPVVLAAVSYTRRAYLACNKAYGLRIFFAFLREPLCARCSRARMYVCRC